MKSSQVMEHDRSTNRVTPPPCYLSRHLMTVEPRAQIRLIPFKFGVSIVSSTREMKQKEFIDEKGRWVAGTSGSNDWRSSIAW